MILTARDLKAVPATTSVQPAPVPPGWRSFVWRMGPITPAVIGVPTPSGGSRAVMADADHPTEIPVLALLDTGTSHSFATRALFDRLSLTPTGEHIRIIDVAEVRQQDNYRVDLALPFTVGGGALVLRNCALSDTASLFGVGRPWYDLVIGCDVLQHCRFTIDGPRSLFRLEPGQ